MSQITIRDLDAQVEYIIREKARSSNTSLSSVAGRLLKESLGIETGSQKKRSLRALAGTWSTEDLNEFEMTQADFSRIDTELWK